MSFSKYQWIKGSIVKIILKSTKMKFYQKEDIDNNTDIIYLKKNTIEILDLKNNWSENLLGRFNSKFELAEKLVNLKRVNWDYPVWGTEEKITKRKWI